MDHSIRSHAGISPNLGLRVFIDPAATVIGNVTLGNDASVWPGAVIRGDMHSISIGCRTSIQDNAVLHISHASDFNPGGWPLVIGDDVIVGHGVILHGCTLPCKQLRAVTDKERRFFTYSPANYVKLKDQYLTEIGL